MKRRISPANNRRRPLQLYIPPSGLQAKQEKLPCLPLPTPPNFWKS